jgi:hypothetical protein
MDFVAFDHIRCCGQPHRTMLNAHKQGQAIPYVTNSIFTSTTINRSATHFGVTQYTSLNTFLVFFR